MSSDLQTHGNCEDLAPYIRAMRLFDSEMRIVPASQSRDWMERTDRRFAKRCLPMLMANQSAWLLLNHCDFYATWSGSPQLDAISVYSDDQLPHDAPASHFGYGILTFTIPFLFRTAPGYNLLVRGPINEPKDGISPLEGLVETDWSAATFTMNWMFTRANTIVHFKKGEPICALVPQKRGELELFGAHVVPITDYPNECKHYESWSQSRRTFNETLRTEKPPEAPWQRDYFQGRAPDGELQTSHQTRLRLAPFLEGHPERSAGEEG